MEIKQEGTTPDALKISKSTGEFYVLVIKSNLYISVCCGTEDRVMT